MSANNIVIIKKEDDSKFRGYDRDYDAWIEGQYDYKGPCQYCDGDNSKCPICGGTGYYTPPEEKPVFEANTIEEAIHAYHKWLDEMNDNEDGFPFIVEYGYTFIGLELNEITEKTIEKTERGEDLHEVAKIEELMKELHTDQIEAMVIQLEERDKEITRLNELVFAYESVNAPINPLFAEYKQLKEALNKHFCTCREHQKKFLGPGVHGRHVDDPETPSGGGCIYCNMIRLEAEAEKLREIKLREIVEEGNKRLRQLNKKSEEN